MQNLELFKEILCLIIYPKNIKVHCHALNESHIIQSRQLIRALTDIRNDHPKITSIWPLGLRMGWISRTMNLTGYMNSSTLTRTSSTISMDFLVDLSQLDHDKSKFKLFTNPNCL